MLQLFAIIIIILFTTLHNEGVFFFFFFHKFNFKKLKEVNRSSFVHMTGLTTPTFSPPQSESEGFSHFHLYVCAAFLLEWRKEILSMVDFQVSGSLCQNSVSSRRKLFLPHWSCVQDPLKLSECSPQSVVAVSVLQRQVSWCRNYNASQSSSWDIMNSCLVTVLLK